MLLSALVVVVTLATFVPAATLLLAAFNWDTFTASLLLVPFATLVICLLPALIPVWVILGPPFPMVKPFVLNSLPPTVTLLKVTSSAVA